MAEENKGETTTLSSVIRSGKKTVYFIAFFLFFWYPARASTATGAKAEFIFSGPLSRRVVPRFSRRARLRGLTLYGKLYIGEKSAPTAHTFVLSQHRRCRRRPRNVFIFLLSRRCLFFPPYSFSSTSFLDLDDLRATPPEKCRTISRGHLSVRGAFVYL